LAAGLNSPLQYIFFIVFYIIDGAPIPSGGGMVL